MEDMGKILVVDDEYPNLALMEGLLVPWGYEVILARSGDDALSLALEQSPDVVLLDIHMPGMDGFEVARRLKGDERTRLIPIVMVTGFRDVSHRVAAIEAGADDFLSKPVEWMELRARVRSLVKVKAYHDHVRDYQKQLESEVACRTEELRLTSDQLRRALGKIKVASLDTIYRLARAAEYRDENTGAHLQRMSHYAAAVARKLGLGERSVEAILYASPMHDVGKIGIPDRILLKPGPLTEQEWAVMRQHTTIGARILEKSSGGFIKLAEIIALTHHEWWDGAGYPRGLRGRRIPLLGRITAIADAFDALTSRRPYKEACSVEVAFKAIEDECGTHFDPGVTEGFLSIREEILDIRGQYMDEG